jgi:hypothetical protein
MTLRYLALTAALLAAPGFARCETATNMTPRACNKVAVAAFDAQNRDAHSDRDDVLLLPGLIADRTAGEVRFLAEATGLEAGTPTEFFLISEASGHDYESLAVAFVQPGHIHQALEFIGMRPGRPVNPGAMQFWPKGERVVATMRPAEGTNANMRAESLLRTSRTGKVFAKTGFVFVGSQKMDLPGKETPVYAADAREPNSILSNYNEPDTVLDVPRIAPQGDVYREQTPNPERLLPTNQLLVVTLKPEYPDGRKRVVDLTLSVSDTGKLPMGLGSLRFDLKDDNGMALGEGMDLNKLLAAFSALTEQGRDPFVVLRVADPVQLGALHGLASVLASIETENGIRVEPPPDGQLYYKAFTPPEALRSRSARIVQPCELHLKPANGDEAAVLVHLSRQSIEPGNQPQLTARKIPVATPEALRRELGALNVPYPVLLVFAQPEVTYRRLWNFLAPIRDSHPIVHVYLDQQPKQVEATVATGP